MSYLAQVQEKYFRTVRIQVVEDRLHKDWYVVQRDVVAGAIVAVLSEYNRQTDAREWKPLGYIGGARLYKGEALKLAKAEAIALSLPFDPKRDLVNIKDVEQGPVQKCVACGQDAGRGRQAAVCPACLNAIAAGKAALQTTAEGLIEAEDLLTYNAGDGRRDEASLELANLLAKMAGARVGNRFTYQSREGAPFIVRNRSNRSGFDKAVYSISLALDVAATMQQVADWMNARLDQAYIKGHKEGTSVLFGLASGKTGIADLNEVEAQRGQMAQAAQKKLDVIAASEADDGLVQDIASGTRQLFYKAITDVLGAIKRNRKVLPHSVVQLGIVVEQLGRSAERGSDNDIKRMRSVVQAQLTKIAAGKHDVAEIQAVLEDIAVVIRSQLPDMGAAETNVQQARERLAIDEIE